MLEAENPNWSILSTGCLVGSMDSDRPELVGDERHVPNRGAALRWIQAGSYRLPIHLAKPARPISEGIASGSACRTRTCRTAHAMALTLRKAY
jgi:hypothetical protein